MNHGLLDGISIIVKMADEKKEEGVSYSEKRNGINQKTDNYQNKGDYRKRDRS